MLVLLSNGKAVYIGMKYEGAAESTRSRRTQIDGQISGVLLKNKQMTTTSRCSGCGDDVSNPANSAPFDYRYDERESLSMTSLV